VFFQEKQVSFGDDSGCPFKHFDSDHLATFLVENYKNIHPDTIQDVSSRVQTENYCSACSLVFGNLKNQTGSQQHEISNLKHQDSNFSHDVDRPSSFYANLMAK